MTGGPGLCRDCFHRVAAGVPGQACPACGSPRVVRHAELFDLGLAHIDCDAFYAAVEKRDDPALANRPLIVGGTGRRGVVATACYLARIHGVRSAMPMYKARRLCPDAVVMRPDMKKYQTVSRAIRDLMRQTTPLVEPLSIDEAFLDLAGTERLHRRPPAETLARLAARVERDIGVTLSVGLSANKFLAKLASDMDKPRGFTVIGRAEAEAVLGPRPVGDIWGVGRALGARLARDGITRVADLRAFDETELMARYGAIGKRLARFCRGRDDRRVDPRSPAKSLSSETTFETDLSEPERLAAILWRLAEAVSAGLKKKDLAGRTVTLKLRTADFAIRTRSRSLGHPTQLADVLFHAAEPLLRRECDGTRFRLIGIAAGALTGARDADPPDLLDPTGGHGREVERAMDAVRAKFGAGAITKGRGFKP